MTVTLTRKIWTNIGHIRPGGQAGDLLAVTVAVPADFAVKVALPTAGAHIAFFGQASVAVTTPFLRSVLAFEVCGLLQALPRVMVSVSPRRRVTDFMLSAPVITTC